MTSLSPTRLRTTVAVLLALMVAMVGLAACGDDATRTMADDETTTTAEAGPSTTEKIELTTTTGGAESDTSEAEAGADGEGEGEAAGAVTYPVTVATDSGSITIEARPERIVSLSPTATEVLYAIGAGDQVAAVDLYSNYPSAAPEGTIDALNVNLETVAAAEPDLVVSQGLPEDVAAGLADLGIPSIVQAAAADLDGVYDQIAQLGEATDHIDQAAEVVAGMRDEVDEIVAGLPEDGEPVRVFHEIDDSFYTATSNTFIGQVYETMGFENIADAHDPDGFGYPLIDAETIITENPTMIVFTNQAPYTADDIAARPGWDAITAVADGNVVQVDADVASRWGPRITEFMRAIAAQVPETATSGS